MLKRLGHFATAAIVVTSVLVACKSRDRRDARGSGPAGAERPGGPAAGPQSASPEELSALKSDPGNMKDGKIFVPVPQLPVGLRLTGELPAPAGLGLTDDSLSEAVEDAAFDQAEDEGQQRLELECSDPDFNPAQTGTLGSSTGSLGSLTTGDDAELPDFWRFYVRVKVAVDGVANPNPSNDAHWRKLTAARLDVVEPITDEVTGDIDQCPGVLTVLKGFRLDRIVMLEGKFVRENEEVDGDGNRTLSNRLVYSVLESDPFLPRRNVNTRFVQRQLVVEEARIQSVVAAGPGDLVAVGQDRQMYFRKVDLADDDLVANSRWVAARVVTNDQWVAVEGHTELGVLGLQYSADMDKAKPKSNWYNGLFVRRDLDTAFHTGQNFSQGRGRGTSSLKARFRDVTTSFSNELFFLYDEFGSTAGRLHQRQRFRVYKANNLRANAEEVPYAPTLSDNTSFWNHDGDSTTADVARPITSLAAVSHLRLKGMLAVLEPDATGTGASQLYFSENLNTLDFELVGVGTHKPMSTITVTETSRCSG